MLLRTTWLLCPAQVCLQTNFTLHSSVLRLVTISISTALRWHLLRTCLPDVSCSFRQFSNSSLGRSSSSIWEAGVRSESWLPIVFLVRLYDLYHRLGWAWSFRLLRRMLSAVTTWGTKVTKAWPSSTKWGIKLQKLDNKSSPTESRAFFLILANEDLSKLGWDVAYLVAWLAWIWFPVWHKPAMVVHTYHPKAWEVEAEGPEV